MSEMVNFNTAVKDLNTLVERIPKAKLDELNTIQYQSRKVMNAINMIESKVFREVQHACTVRRAELQAEATAKMRERLDTLTKPVEKTEEKPVEKPNLVLKKPLKQAIKKAAKAKSAK